MFWLVTVLVIIYIAANYTYLSFLNFKIDRLHDAVDKLIEEKE